MNERNDQAGEQVRDAGELGLVSHALGGLPIVNHLLGRLGLPRLLDAGAFGPESGTHRHLPTGSGPPQPGMPTR